MNWASSTIGAGSNAGVAGKIKGTDGAIGYVDFADAKLGRAQRSRRQELGRQVRRADARRRDGRDGGGDGHRRCHGSPMNSSGADAYPITSPTYIIVYTTQTSHAQGTALKALLEYVLGAGQAKAAALNFAGCRRHC